MVVMISKFSLGGQILLYWVGSGTTFIIATAAAKKSGRTYKGAPRIYSHRYSYMVPLWVRAPDIFSKVQLYGPFMRARPGYILTSTVIWSLYGCAPRIYSHKDSYMVPLCVREQ